MGRYDRRFTDWILRRLEIIYFFRRRSAWPNPQIEPTQTHVNPI
jgi:hypothetical protein